MRSLLLLLLIVACVLPIAWAAACSDSNTNFGDGCYSSVVEPGYVCPSSGKCVLSPAGQNATNAAANLIFATNFNNGIFDISTNHISFSSQSGVTCNQVTDTNHAGYCTFAGSGVISTTCPTTFPSVIQPRTTCMWMRVPTTLASGNAIAFSYGSSSAMGKGWAVGLTVGNKVIVTGYMNSYPSTGAPVAANTWTHVCAAFTNSPANLGVTVWVNGAPTSGSLTGNLATQVTSATLNIGAHLVAGNSWTGDLFDIRMYSVALTDPQVQAIMTENAANLALVSLSASCGNGIFEAGEGCDDNNLISGDGCDCDCHVEPRWYCSGSPSVCSYGLNAEIDASADTSFVTSTASTVQQSSTVIDTSGLSWTPVNVQYNRIGEFYYTISGLTPSASYTIDFVFAETVYTAANQRVFTVEVQGASPQWSPIDIFAVAGRANAAIGKSVTTLSDPQGIITIEFSDNAEVQALRYTRVTHNVAVFSTAGALTVAGSGTAALFNPVGGYADFTMEVYAYISTVAAGTLIAKGSDFSLGITASGKAVCIVGGVTTNGASTLPTSSWVHVACVVGSSSGKVSIYVNGMLDISQTATPAWTVSSSQLTFGTSFTGFLDRPRLWQRALSSGELLSNALSSAYTPALASYGLIEEWTFDAPSSTPSVSGTIYGSTYTASFSGTNSFDAGSAATAVGINCGGTANVVPTLVADSFFVGGTVSSTIQSVTDAASLGFPGSVYQTARTGAFSYVLSGLPIGQSYLITVGMVDYTGASSSMALYINQIEAMDSFDLFSNSGSYTTAKFIYTTTADYSGSITLQFTGAASICAIKAVPIAAPSGSARFLVGVAGRTPLRLKYEALTTYASGSPTTFTASNLIGHAATSAPYTPITDVTYTSAITTTSSTITIPSLIPDQVYLLRMHFAELNPLYNTAGARHFDISLIQDAGTTLWKSGFDIYTSAGSKLFTSYTIKKFITANNDGTISVLVGNGSPAALVNGIEVIPGPAIFGSQQTFPLNAQTVTIPGAHLLSVQEQSSTLAVNLVQTGSPVACSSLAVKLNSVVCTVPAASLAAGAISAQLLIDGATVLQVPLGTVLPALSLTASTDPIATNAESIVLLGAGFSDMDNVQVGVTSSSSAAPNIACNVQSASPQVIVCVPVSALPVGPLYAVVTSSGASTSNVQIGTVIVAPQIGNVATVYASSSTMVITGKYFMASPNQNQNTVVLSQAVNSRKRSTTPSTAPSCPIISASTTTITCALSNVFAGQLTVTVMVAGGSSSTFTITVQPAQTTGRCLPPFGTPDAYDGTLCNCWSGYAPSSTLYEDCNVHPTCIREIVDVTSTGPAMSTPTTTFFKDHLYIHQSSPIVNNRRDTTIRFSVPTGLSSIIPVSAVPGSVGSPSCGYPGNLWVKTVDASECLDVYSATLPWSGHSLCGFVNDNGTSNSTHLVFKAQMDTTYISAYPSVGGGYVERVSTDSFIVTVAFRKTLTFTTTISTEFVESSTEGFVTISVDGSDYDPNTRTMVIVLTAETGWPYQLNLTQVSAGTFFSDEGASASSITSTFTGSVDNEQYGQTDIYACSAKQDSTCIQIMIAKFVITNTSLCDIAGVYKFNATQLLCRDVQVGEQCPGNPKTTVQFTVGTTNLCEDTAVDPSGSVVPSLAAFSDNTLSDGPQTEFYDNDIAFFNFALESDLASVDSVTFNFIQVSLNPDNGNHDILYDITQNPAQQINNISLQLQEINSLVHAGQPMSANFSFQLSTTKLVNTVHMLALTSPGIPSQLLITATVDIAFHGNSRKRSVSFDFVTSGTTKTASHPITFHHVARSNVAIHNQNNNNNNDEKNGVMPAIGVDNIWAELGGNDQVQTEFGDWFGGLESSGYKLNMSFFMLVACYLLVHIIIA